MRVLRFLGQKVCEIGGFVLGRDELIAAVIGAASSWAVLYFLEEIAGMKKIGQVKLILSLFSLFQSKRSL